MKSIFYLVRIVIFVMPLTITLGAAQTLTINDLNYYNKQNSVFSTELIKYFDLDKPDYHSVERRNALYLIDAITHYPPPHDECLKQMFIDRYKKVIASVQETQVKSGVVIWNIYNMSYVIKTPEITIGIDLTRLPPSLRVDGKEEAYKSLAQELVKSCDILFISHIHNDHADLFVAEEFISQNKPVISNLDIFKNEDIFDQIIHLSANGRRTKFSLEESGVELELGIYPGHQAISADAAVDNNFTLITLPNDITIAHSGDQSWEDDFVWIDTIHEDVEIDVLMVNTWTLWPDRLVSGLQPKVILPGHINEMEHSISSRIPYWKSYQSWQNNESKVIHLFWGEAYTYNKIID